jgi:peptidoglycan/xylan/chitin deacetylase (PgdA/CDA1 family)
VSFDAPAPLAGLEIAKTMETRHLVLAGRLAAALGVLTMRGRARAIAWRAHDFLWLYPTLRRNCRWHGEVLTRFRSQQRAIWLTIDDGPDPESTPKILDLLAKHDAKAAFFVVGRKVEQDPGLCRQMISDGHLVENHTYSHPAGWWWAMPRPLVRREIERGYHAILSATGQAPRFFRSPVGMNNSSVHPVAAGLGLRLAGWSVDGCDGCPAAPTSIVTRIIKAIRPGAIVLIHQSGRSRHCLITLARLLDKLDEAGYRSLLPPEHLLH